MIKNENFCDLDMKLNNKFTCLKKQIFTNLRLVTVTTVVAIFLFWPLFKFATGTIEGRLRFNEVTIFNLFVYTSV